MTNLVAPVLHFDRALRQDVIALPTLLGRCILEARPVVLVIFLVRFTSGSFLAWGRGGPAHIGTFLLGLLMCACATIFVYLFNGVADVTEDRVNGSQRPIARGDLDPAVASRVACGSAVVATVLGFVLSQVTGFLVIALLICGYLYSGRPFYLKRFTWGTIAIATLGGVITYAGGYSVVPDGPGGGTPLVIFVGVMSLWMGVVGGMSKDLSDVVGDRVAGRRTTVVRWGQTHARLVIAGAALCCGGGSLLLAARLAPVLLGAALALAVGACGVAALTLSRRPATNRSERRRPYYLFMITQYAAHLGLFAGLALL